jgi:hypothetical protein
MRAHRECFSPYLRQHCFWRSSGTRLFQHAARIDLDLRHRPALYVVGLSARALRRVRAGGVGSGYTRPLRTAQTAAWVRSLTAILRRMFWTCSLTVSTLISSERPISLLLKPKATCRRT